MCWAWGRTHTRPPDKTNEGDGDVLGVGARAHAADAGAVPPNKTKQADGDVLGVGTKAHAVDKAVVPPDNTKVVSLHYARADHRSGVDGTSPGEHRSARPSTGTK